MITPEEVTRRAAPSAEELDRIESSIDAELIEMARSGYWPGISVRGLCVSGWPVIDTIMNRYRQAGWDVSIYSDQRDGDDFIQFKKPVKRGL